MGVSLAIEGPEGGGKSFLFSLSAKLIWETTGLPLMRSTEPGGTSLGEAIRKILKSPGYSDMHAIAGTLLFNAARAELYFKYEKPFLEANPRGILLKERCWLSTDVYQKVEGADAEYVARVTEPFIGIPEFFAIIDCPVGETQVRMAAIEKFHGNREVDWRDLLPEDNLQRYRDAYLKFAQENKDRCIMLDCFDDPWNKAARIKFEILRLLANKEGTVISANQRLEMLREFSKTAREIVETRETWFTPEKRNIREFPIEELRAQVEAVRSELGFPARSELQIKMHEEWQRLGLEGFSSGIEQGK